MKAVKVKTCPTVTTISVTAAAAVTCVLLLPLIHNPLGSSWSEEESEARESGQE